MGDTKWEAHCLIDRLNRECRAIIIALMRLLLKK